MRAQLQSLLDAGATDLWAAVFPVGADRDQRAASVRRSTDLLKELVASGVRDSRRSETAARE